MKIRRSFPMIVATILIAILVLGLVAAMSLRRLQRAFFYPRPTNMPSPVTDDISAALRRFESALAKHAPEVLNALEPGLSDQEISAIGDRHGIHLTDDLKALYKWRNGSSSVARVEMIPGMRFVPLQEATQMRDDMRLEAASQPLAQRLAYEVFAGHRNGWMTVLVDGSGDGYFYDQSRRSSGGYFFYCFAEDGSYRFFPSLTNFLVGAAECYESDIFRRDRNGGFSEDYERSFALWPRYAAWPER
jgi:cell wall assembly regulator SMI1